MFQRILCALLISHGLLVAQQAPAASTQGQPVAEPLPLLDTGIPGGIILHGSDRLGTAISQTISGPGQVIQSATSRGLQQFGLSRSNAEATDNLLQLVGAGGVMYAVGKGPLLLTPSLAPAAKEGGSLTRLKNWWNTGSEADGAWRALPLKDKAFYEIGQKTLPGKTFENYATLDPVARGRALVNDLGWPRAIWPQGTGYRLGVGTTLPTGPTPLVRWAVPRAAGAAGAGAAAGAGYYFFNSED